MVVFQFLVGKKLETRFKEAVPVISICTGLCTSETSEVVCSAYKVQRVSLVNLAANGNWEQTHWREFHRLRVVAWSLQGTNGTILHEVSSSSSFTRLQTVRREYFSRYYLHWRVCAKIDYLNIFAVLKESNCHLCSMWHCCIVCINCIDIGWSKLFEFLIMFQKF